MVAAKLWLLRASIFYTEALRSCFAKCSLKMHTLQGRIIGIRPGNHSAKLRGILKNNAEYGTCKFDRGMESPLRYRARFIEDSSCIFRSTLILWATADRQSGRIARGWRACGSEWWMRDLLGQRARACAEDIKGREGGAGRAHGSGGGLEKRRRELSGLHFHSDMPNS